MTKAVLVSAQFLVKLPEGENIRNAQDYGVDWLGGLFEQSDALEYRHPKIAGVYIRPVPVQIRNMDVDVIFDDSNLCQL